MAADNAVAVKAAAAGRSLHGLGVICGLAAGVWLGAAEAPTKLVNAGFSPFAVSLCMVAGVFTARWTFPTLLKGTSYVFADLFARKHLIVWAILAGALWAVANTLTVFAIRDVGLATAFPLWNTNSLIGLLWGVLLFRELQGAPAKNIVKVVCGAICIVGAAIMLGFTIQGGSGASPHALRGLLAAAGASLMWGTMYVPYRKAYRERYESALVRYRVYGGRTGYDVPSHLDARRGHEVLCVSVAPQQAVAFLAVPGGLRWVVGDLFQQFAAKYLGIGRGIPLSNTNQLWGLAWGALVFGELASANRAHLALVVGGSVLMLIGALSISTAVASSRETISRNHALQRECDRYGLDYREVLLAQSGEEFSGRSQRRRWWDVAIVVAACALFLWLGINAVVPPLAMNLGWIAALTLALLTALIGAGWALWRQTRFG